MGLHWDMDKNPAWHGKVESEQTRETVASRDVRVGDIKVTFKRVKVAEKRINDGYIVNSWETFSLLSPDEGEYMIYINGDKGTITVPSYCRNLIAALSSFAGTTVESVFRGDVTITFPL